MANSLTSFFYYKPLFQGKNIFWFLFILSLEALLGVAIVFGSLDKDYYLYSIIGLCGIMVMFVALLRPHWGYLLLIFLIPFRSEEFQIIEFGGSIIRAADIFVVPVIIGWLLYSLFITRDRKFLGKTEMDVPLLVFFGWAAASFAWSAGRVGTISIMLQIVYAFLLFYLSIDLIKTRRFLFMVLLAWILSGVVIGALSVYGSYITPAERIAGGSVTILRETSTQTNALELGEFINYPLMLGIGLYLISKKFSHKILFILAVLVMFMAHITSVARGPIIGLAAGLAFFTLVSKDFRKLMTRELIIVLLGGTTLIAIFSLLMSFDLVTYIEALISRFRSMVENPSADPGIMFRIVIWSALIKIIIANPLLGVGFGAVSEPLAKATAPFYLETPHNLYLHNIAELGLIGLGIFLWIIIRFYKIIRNSLKTVRDRTYEILIISFAAAVFTKVVGGLTWGFLIQDRSLWLCLGLGIAMINLAYREQHGDKGMTQQGAR